jgi:hypothetical protein
MPPTMDLRQIRDHALALAVVIGRFCGSALG